MVTETNQPSASVVRPSLPPEEKFWRRYSPHHEMPLSVAGSFTVHGLVIGLLILVGVLVAMVGLTEKDRQLPGEAINVISEGSGGLENGIKSGAGDNASLPKENVANVEGPQKSANGVEIGAIDPKTSKQPIDAPLLESKEHGKDFIKQAQRAGRSLQNTGQAAQALVQRLAPKGKGQPGSGGVKDKGRGPSNGPGDGDAKRGNLDVKQKRMIRWRMRFEVLNGADYLKQLDSLGAILGVPDPDGQLRIIRDLKRRPVQGKLEDLSQIQRIFWVDDEPKSVQSLAAAMGLERVPPHIVAFFPEKLEKEMAQKERNYRGKQENEIEETHFLVVRKGLRCEPIVVFQK